MPGASLEPRWTQNVHITHTPVRKEEGLRVKTV